MHTLQELIKVRDLILFFSDISKILKAILGLPELSCVVNDIENYFEILQDFCPLNKIHYLDLILQN